MTLTLSWIALGVIGVATLAIGGYWLWRSGALLWWYANQDGIDDEDTQDQNDASIEGKKRDE